MERKKGTVTKVLLFFAIFIIIILCYFAYKFYNDNIRLSATVDSLTGTVETLQGKINNISQIVNSDEEQDNKQEVLNVDYSKYYGTWGDNNNNEFTVKNIGNDLITFTWFIYRTASIDDVTLPFEDNKTFFYYHGYDDKNFNSVNEDDEFYCRKATIELKEDSVFVKVENSTLEEANNYISQDKTDLFGGGVYIGPGEYNFTIKK